MSRFDIPYYEDYLSSALFERLRPEMRPVPGVPGLSEVGESGGLESPEGLTFVCALYEELKADLGQVLAARIRDREFIDSRTRATVELNTNLHVDFLDPEYETVLGHEDSSGRIVVGPKNAHYCRAGYGEPVAAIPEFLTGSHVTLFGPPDDAKLSINAMNAIHRKLPGEPAVVAELLESVKGPGGIPKWGADDEDSKTPIRADLISAGENLTQCLEGTLTYRDPKSGKEYRLSDDRLSLPIKRFPGLALPSLFLFYRENPLPLHLYDFALHLYRNWRNPAALAFYVPKLENEEEAAYIRKMVAAAERRIQSQHPEYGLGSVRLFIVLENPRAIFRTNEIMDELFPYFAGASLGWHDYLASTARLFKEDPNYRIPVKADPNIVIHYIKASHDLLDTVVGSRGGIKIGGMYGVLPIDSDPRGPSFQVTLRGFFRDVITQMKRNLSGFWVAHPDFVRIGIALVRAWELHRAGDSTKLESLVEGLLLPEYRSEILTFIGGSDIAGLSVEDPLYARSLIVADVRASSTVANHDPEEVRYNIFQSLQYLTDWLSGNGCVALPAEIEGVAVRVMDDLATAERSRWEVWHEIRHGRFSKSELIRIAHEEMHFIRKDLSDERKIVQVKWNERTEKWYPVAFQLMLRLMTADRPVEFATELLLPFTLPFIRAGTDPFRAVTEIDPEKYRVNPEVEHLDFYFGICGSLRFARQAAERFFPELSELERVVKSFSLAEVIEAASFHGDIGEGGRTLDAVAAREQARVLAEGDSVRQRLRELGSEYRAKFGVKYLVSADGKSAGEILANLEVRMGNSPELELLNARAALWEISKKRLRRARESLGDTSIVEACDRIREKHGVPGFSVSVTSPGTQPRAVFGGDAVRARAAVGNGSEEVAIPVTAETEFEIASLSKTLATVIALEYFRKRNLGLDASVNALLATTSSKFRLRSLDPLHPEWADSVTILNLMRHNALNLHYVNGVPADRPMPNVREFLTGNSEYGYDPVGVLHAPGSAFQYSGGGFLVLEHLIECLEGRPLSEITAPFFRDLGISDLSLNPKHPAPERIAHGYRTDGSEVPTGWLKFPALAAGGYGTASAMAKFLIRLTDAFHSPLGSAPISHDTAVRMLGAPDPSSDAFMGVGMGIGVFIAEAGVNRLAVHQGANDGFRALFVHCFQGPDRGKGFTIFANADSNGVLFVTEVAQDLLRRLKIGGVDTGAFRTEWSPGKTASAEIVNRAYRDLIFSAFSADLPEPIVAPGPPDPLAPFNRAVGARVIHVTNQRFARAENLFSPRLPAFDPDLYGNQGKIMDSWESVRHNSRDSDTLTFQIPVPTVVRYLSLSTQFHLGNQSPAVSLEGRESSTDEWFEILPVTPVAGHALRRVRIENNRSFSEFRVAMIPDGGFSRLGIFDDSLPGEFAKDFLPVEKSENISFPEKIPHPTRPLTPKYPATPARIARNWSRVSVGATVDFASIAYGAKVVSASNEHYGPAAQVISPYPPLNMFDGFESARSRVAGHTEEVVIELAREAVLERIEVDFTFFRNNNPRALSIQGLVKGAWVPLVARTEVKAFAGNLIHFTIPALEKIARLKVTVHPDGGLNRVRAFGKVGDSK